jgi:hypothetical protein
MSQAEQKPRELKLKPRFESNVRGCFFDGYDVIDGSLTMDNADEVYHVVEMKALEQAQARIRELEDKWENEMYLSARANTARQYAETENAKLKAQLSDAVKALEKIAMDFGTDFCSDDSITAYETLAKLRGEG